jgi:predicted HD phosphohydrolase
MRIVGEVMDLPAGPGREADLGEEVSQAKYALQAAWLAVRGPEQYRSRIETAAKPKGA